MSVRQAVRPYIVESITFIEETFDMAMTDEELVPEHLDSVERIATFVEKKQSRMVS